MELYVLRLSRYIFFDLSIVCILLQNEVHIDLLSKHELVQPAPSPLYLYHLHFLQLVTLCQLYLALSLTSRLLLCDHPAIQTITVFASYLD